MTPENPAAARKPTTPETNKPVRSALLCLAAILACGSLAACPQQNTAGNSSGPTAGQASSGASTNPGTAGNSTASPEQASRLDSAIARELPLDSSITLQQVSQQQGGGIQIEARSSRDVLETCTWLLTRLAQLGYETDDNASRMLEGADYTKPRGKVRSLHLQVTLDNAGNCILTMRTGGKH